MDSTWHPSQSSSPSLIQTYLNEQEFDLITSDPLTYYIVQQVVVAEVKSVSQLAAQLSFRDDLSAKVKPTLEKMRRLGMVSLSGEFQDEIELLKSDFRYTVRSAVRAQLLPMMFEIGARRAVSDCDEGRKNLSFFSISDDAETRHELDELVLEFKDKMRQIGSRTAGRKAQGVRFVGLINTALAGSDYVRSELVETSSIVHSTQQKSDYKNMQQAAHDVRPVLAALHALTEKMEAQLDPETRVLTQAVLGRLERIANEFLPVSQRNAAPAGDNTSQSLKTLACEKATIWGDSVKLVLDISNTVWGSLVVSRTDFERVISNLLDNAKQAFTIAHVAPEIRVVTLARNGAIEIRIEDNGPGISANLLSRLRQGECVTTKADGHGLGLSHAIQTVRSAGGIVEIQSTPGLGTCVTLLLPMV